VIVPQSFATFLARTLEAFRDAAAKDEQKTQFRALLGLLKAGRATLRVSGSTVYVNRTPVEGTGLFSLAKRLELLGIEEITIEQDPPPQQLFELLRALADRSGSESIADRLRAAGVDKIAVQVSSGDRGTDTIATASLDMLDLPSSGSAPPSAAPTAAHDAPAESDGADQSAIAKLERNPRSPDAPDLLQTISREIENAMRARRPEEAMRLIAAIARSEQVVPDGDQRRWFAITLKRLLTRPVLEALAHLVTFSGYREEAVVALQRGGADAVEVMLDLLVAAPTVQERQALFVALTEMKDGTDQLVHMLGHSQWFVVRNVAELVGELGLEEAVPALAKQLKHEDERVRKAVALALAKIGNRAAAEPLRRALRDKSPGVRIQAALGVGGRKSSALAMPLVVAMEDEDDPEVERELILALGRIGSADAVQALIKFAQPSGRVFRRKPAGLRIAAVEALRVAATPAAIGMLQGLAEDSDKQIRIAAQEALKDVKGAF
jgi:HEAT repeat protein